MSFMEIHREGTGLRDPETINPDDFDYYRFSDDFKPHCDRFQNANGYWLRYTPVNLHAGFLVQRLHREVRIPDHQDTVAVVVRSLTLLDKWQRRKREADKYPELGSKTIFDQYRRELEAQMRIDDCSDIVNRSFDRTTLTAEQVEIDDARQDFMYLAFLKTWKDTHPQAIIRQYETTRDARAAWNEVFLYYTTSTAVTIDIQKSIGWLSTARFTKDKFIGTSTQFYDTWLDRLRQYNFTVPTAEALTDAIALQMLKMSFSEEPSFFKIQTDENARVIQGGGKFTFEEYKTALKDQCGIFDKMNYKDKAIAFHSR